MLLLLFMTLLVRLIYSFQNLSVKEITLFIQMKQIFLSIQWVKKYTVKPVYIAQPKIMTVVDMLSLFRGTFM